MFNAWIYKINSSKFFIRIIIVYGIQIWEAFVITLFEVLSKGEIVFPMDFCRECFGTKMLV